MPIDRDRFIESRSYGLCKALHLQECDAPRDEHAAKLILEDQLRQTDLDQKAKDGLRRLLAVLTDYSSQAS